MSVLNSLLDPQLIIRTLGLIGIVFIIFAESGLFFGFFFPGDSLLFTAGFLASQGIMPIWWLLILCGLAAIIGDNVGYAFGKKTGPMIFSKDNSIFFNKKHLHRAQAFYDKYGKKTIVLARFVPIVRTFAPIVAGIANMNYKTFFSYNLIGGLAWTWSMLAIGYFLGRSIPGVDKYLTPIILIIIFISLIPAIVEFFKQKSMVK